MLFPLLSGVFLLLFLELMSFGVGLAVKKDMFSREDAYFASIDEAGFKSWKESPWFDPELGWNVPQGVASHREKNCLGQEVVYSFASGHRLDEGSAEAPRAALFGDSYTYGHEVADNETISSALWRNHRIAALNFGAPGYSPEQAVLKFERLAKQKRLPPVAVLSIMHENIRRTPTSLRAVYASGTDIRYGLKPFMRNGALQTLAYPETYEDYVAEARRRFRDDYWARPQLAFPFTISLFKAFNKAWRSGRLDPFGAKPFHHEYHEDNELRRNLAAVIGRFQHSAGEFGLKPVVIFIPQNHETYQVSAPFAASVGAFEFTDREIDWRRYNLKPEGECHPSSYGTWRIANFIAARLGL